MPDQEMLDSNFRYGWNADLPSIMVSNDELILADNTIIMARGAVKKRPGVINYFNDKYFNGEVKQIISWPRDDGTEDILAIIDNNLCDITSGTAITIQAVQGDRIPYFFLHDKFYFIDPDVEYYVYDGSTCAPVTPNPEEDNNLDPIKRCKFAFWHSESNRIFYAGDSQERPAVYFSEYNQPDYVKGDSVVYPTRADGPVKALSVLMDAVIVGYRYSNWIWRGIDPARDVIWEKIPTAHGPLNGDCFTITTNSLSLISKGGVFALHPSIIGLPMEAEASKDYITNLAKDKVLSVIQSITEPDKIRTIFDSDTGQYMIAYCDDNSQKNNKILVFDWQTGAFSRYEGLQINDFCKRQNGDILLATDSCVLQFDEDSTEDITSEGIAKVINFKIKTAKYALGTPLLKKKVSRIFVIFKNCGALHELKVSLIVDDELKETYTITGDDTAIEVITHRKKTTYIGNNFQLEIENTQYSKAEIYGVGFYYTHVNPDGVKL